MNESEINRCFTCNKVGTVATPLQRCSRCHLTRYCSRECQQTDWFRHRRNCPLPRPQPPSLQSLDLDPTRWLYNRTETMTYKLLTDSYRMNVWFFDDGPREDEPRDDEPRDDGPLPCGEEKFRKFLLRVSEHTRQLLPPWWTPEKAEQCIEFAKPSLELGVEGLGPDITTVKVWVELLMFTTLIGWKSQ